ncbi:MAG: hypothetical protein JKY84_08440 [Emcibacteraceae bacterium]|nr:hypothetical protein [Emcibacteraceae bacterium]
MKFYILLMLTILSACGGRPKNIMAEKQNIDEQMTCVHISGEHEMNIAKIQDISKERKSENANNFGLLLIAPLFLDLSNTEKEEIIALQNRNSRLEQLSLKKECNIFTPTIDDE